MNKYDSHLPLYFEMISQNGKLFDPKFHTFLEYGIFSNFIEYEKIESFTVCSENVQRQRF